MKLLPTILGEVAKLEKVRTIADPFSGSGRVSVALSLEGYTVTASDYMLYAHCLADTYIGDGRLIPQNYRQAIKEELEAATPFHGFFTETYGVKSRFFSETNCMVVDGMLEKTKELELPNAAYNLAVTMIIEAADKVDSTVGQQAAYLKQYAPRACKDISLTDPITVIGSGESLHADCFDALKYRRNDLVYLDPPYTHHAYAGMYHVWETIAQGDAPEVYGVACKRADTKEKKSPFNSKVKVKDAFNALLQACNSRYVMLSYNSEGLISYGDIMNILEQYFSDIRIVEVPHRRYVGSRIGVYNKEGVKVGEPTHHKCKEFLFVCTK